MTPIVLTSPNGRQWNVTVSDAGVITAVPISPAPVLVPDPNGNLWRLVVNATGDVATEAI